MNTETEKSTKELLNKGFVRKPFKLKLELFKSHQKDITTSLGMFEVEFDNNRARVHNNNLFQALAGHSVSRYNRLKTLNSYVDGDEITKCCYVFTVNGKQVFFNLGERKS